MVLNERLALGQTWINFIFAAVPNLTSPFHQLFTFLFLNVHIIQNVGLQGV